VPPENANDEVEERSRVTSGEQDREPGDYHDYYHADIQKGEAPSRNCADLRGEPGLGDVALPDVSVAADPLCRYPDRRFRAVLWGLIFAPFGGIYDASLLPHGLTMLIEGEACVIAMLGVWLWWPVFSTSGQRLHKWRQRLGLQGRVPAAVACTLLVAAVYEVLEVIYLIVVSRERGRALSGKHAIVLSRYAWYTILDS